MKRLIVVLLCVCMLFSSVQVALAANGDTNVDGGGGGTTGGTGKNFWNPGDDGVRVTIIREHDQYSMAMPVDFSNQIAESELFHFQYKNKLSYTNGTSLKIMKNGYRNVTPAFPIPQVVSNSGAINIAAVKTYFSREGTIKDICAKTGFDFDKLESGEYIILLEPLVYITYGGIRFCMTATEAALYDRVVSGDLKIKLGNITHQNLPLGMFLERPELGFPAWSGPMSGFRTNEEIISQLGLGTVRFKPLGCCNHVDDCPCKRPDSDTECDCDHPGTDCGPDTPDCDCIPKDEGAGGGGGSGTKYYDYRADTDVITTIEVEDGIGGDSGTSPDVNARVTFHIDGDTYTVPWVCPPDDSTFVWIKWHTPERAKTITISVTSSTGAVLTPTVIARVSELAEITPPDPDSRDTRPGFHVPSLPHTSNMTKLQWGEWIPKWNPQWRQESTGHRDSCSDKCESSHYKWVGRWEYKWKSYEATLGAKTMVAPAEQVPTARGTAGDYTMKSHYGVNVAIEAQINATGKNGDITDAQNAVVLFPEFQYQTYFRVMEPVRWNKFKLKPNPYSQYKAPSHFTPIWYPDGAQYTPQTVVFDIWTPAGQLYIYGDDGVTIQGSVFDDWHVGPAFA